MDSASIPVFVYGTFLPNIRNRAKKYKRNVGYERSHIVANFKGVDAILEGFARIWPKDAGYPFIIPKKGHSVNGRVYFVDRATLDLMDKIEGVGSNYFVREKHPVKLIKTNEKIDAYVYVGKGVLKKFKYDPTTDEIPRL